MKRSWCALTAALALVAASVCDTFAQESTGGATAQPTPFVSGQSAPPQSGGSSSGGAAPEQAVPLPPPPPPPELLPPGPAAGPQQAAFLSNAVRITGGVAITAAVICALTCFSHSTSTTTSTVVQHH